MKTVTQEFPNFPPPKGTSNAQLHTEQCLLIERKRLREKGIEKKIERKGEKLIKGKTVQDFTDK